MQVWAWAGEYSGRVHGGEVTRRGEGEGVLRGCRSSRAQGSLAETGAGGCRDLRWTMWWV